MKLRPERDRCGDAVSGGHTGDVHKECDTIAVIFRVIFIIVCGAGLVREADEHYAVRLTGCAAGGFRP